MNKTFRKLLLSSLHEHSLLDKIAILTMENPFLFKSNVSCSIVKKFHDTITKISLSTSKFNDCTGRWTFYRIRPILQGHINFINCLQLTCNFVSDEFTAFYLADGREERPNFFLGHRLRKVIHNEICLTLLLLATSIRLWRGIVWIWRRWGWRIGVHSAILLWHSVHAVLHHFIW